MKYLLSCMKELRRPLACRPLLLLMDYDGTLVPIAKKPSLARLPKKTENLLEDLASSEDTKLAIVSGRALTDIYRSIRSKKMIFVGNHGFEIRSKDINFSVMLPAGFKRCLAEIKERLTDKLACFKGILIEGKGLTLSIHYRLVLKKDVPFVKNVFRDVMAGYVAAKKARISIGKKVFEVLPPVAWDKGKAVSWLLSRYRAKAYLPIYIGDDVTDEDAFRKLKRRGITIFVGRPSAPSSADYYLKNVKEVTGLLRTILSLKEGDPLCRN